MKNDTPRLLLVVSPTSRRWTVDHCDSDGVWTSAPVDDGPPHRWRSTFSFDAKQIRARARRLAELAEIEAMVLRSAEKGSDR